MIAIPAIDLLDGHCVRLRQGSYDDVTRYDADPAEVALQFQTAGAKRIHVVDLDAARGSGSNRPALKRIRQVATCTLEVGGGVRTEADAEELFDLGIDYAVVGTVFAKAPDTVAQWIRRWGRRFIAGVDARDGRVRVRGWQEGTEISACEAMKTAEAIGIAAVEYTDISRDGAMTGPNIAGTMEITRCSSLPVILSGGVGSEEDLRAIRRDAPTLHGVILGRAIYDGKIDVGTAVRILQEELKT